MNIDIAVVGHPQRLDMALQLARQADGTLLLDTMGLGCERMHILALQAMLYAPIGPADWHVVLEDDAVPVHNFRYHATRALKHAHSTLVSFYLGTGHNPGVQAAIRNACALADAGAAWITSDALMGGQGYAVHRSILARLLDAIDNPADPAELPLRITRWAQRANIDVDYTWPSLVNHRDGWSVIAQAESTGRVAHRHGTRKSWNTGAVRMEVPGWSRESQPTQED